MVANTLTHPIPQTEYVKWVDFAYPTSAYAKQFAPDGAGCYVVELVYPDRPYFNRVQVATCATLDEALVRAATLPQEWYSLTRSHP